VTSDFHSTCVHRNRLDDTDAFLISARLVGYRASVEPEESTLEIGAAEMGAAIRCPVVGDSPRGKETAEPLTSTPEPWSPSYSCF
jgi:hypothetical protein